MKSTQKVDVWTLKMKPQETPKRAGCAIEILADFIASTGRNYSDIAVERSRYALIDTIGCMLIGCPSDETQSVLKCVSDFGIGEAIVFGSTQRLQQPWAALVNATSAHCLDYDDWDDQSLAHTSAVIYPTILACATDRDLTGADLTDAHIVAVEVLLRIGEAVNPSHYWQGWHATSTLGALGATAAACRLLQLDRATTAHALSLATSMSGGLTSQFGSMAKPLHAGLASKAGVLAASLAKAGVTGTAQVLDGPVSIRSTMSYAAEDAFNEPLGKLGHPWAIEQHGLHVKMYPSCGGTHRIIDAAINLKQEHGLQIEDILEVEVRFPAYLEDLLPYKVPENKSEALFSFPYCAAIALDRGKVGVEEFEPEALTDASVLDLARRVKIVPRDVKYTTRLFEKGDFDSVRVKMRSGEVFETSVDVPYGAPPRLADERHVNEKFVKSVGHVYSNSFASKLIDLLKRQPEEWSLNELASLSESR